MDWLNISTLNSFNLYFLLVLLVWTVFWKGIALWESARNNHKIWFIVLLVVNTVGILEIIYIFLVAKKSEKEKKIKS